jgi:acyl-coenzyme A synthetase/AMP-(fatty) acid ligase/alkanesulfonate monooxygenase SsuD/methylene tetrahydromethanopterin reductase-like flavin-dependent oxidoreductase (luciferase family)
VSALRIGVRVPQYGTSWEGLREGALRAERLGFDGVWLNDHLQSPGRLKAEPTFDALTSLAALAPLTSHVRLGVVVLSASYRPPALAAKMATILDVISGGRLVVGLGTGSDRAEHAAYGLPFGAPAERTQGVRTALRVMRAMFSSPEGAEVEGVLRAAPNQPPPVQAGGPPVWLAAHRPRLLALAGREADGVVAAFCGADELARRRSLAEEAREEAGRDSALSYAIYTYALPLPSGAEAERWVAAEAAALGTTPRRYLRWLEGTGIVDRPEALADCLDAFASAGATDAVLVLPSRVPLEAMDALAEAALPAAPVGHEAPADPGAAGGGANAAPKPQRRYAGLRADDNLVHTLVGRWPAEGRGEDVAVIDDAGELSYDDLAAAAARAAGALAAAGVRRGERVALPLRDGRGWLAAFLGAAGLGAVAVPLDPDADPERLADVLDDCEPAAVVSEDDGPDPGAWPRLPVGALAEGDPRGPDAVHPRDLAYLVYSSGSTGRPKAAMHAHADLRVGIEGYAAEVLGLGPGDRCHSVAKLFTSLGFGNGFFRVLGRGATAVLAAGRPTVRSVLGQVGDHGVTVLTAVPTFWAQLATFLARHPQHERLATLRLLVSSGDRLPAPVAERLRAEAGIELLEGLGCSECSNVIISTRPGEPLPDALGRVTPGVELRLVGDDGAPVAPGEPGRLLVRSASNTTGYWRRIEETRALLQGEWLAMGDVLREEDGVYRHMGRADDLFKVDARWVSPAEVEAALLWHPAVREAAVVGVPDEDGLLRAAAFVVADPGAGDGEEDLPAALRRHVAHALEPYKAPRVVRLVESLPRLPSGKLDRRRLREAG